jgi:phosphoesterase RecJ-like protein
MINKIIEIINSCETFLITAHVRPDGDAVGSELALYHVLRDMGKEVVIYNQDRTPDVYTFLPASDVIINDLDSVEIFDAAFVLDCSDIERVGDEAERIISIKKIVNIDHHVLNSGFSEISLVDSGASSAGEILYRIIDKLSVPITEDIATNLYTAILTDTGAFCYSNTGSSTFSMAAKLVEAGADPRWIAVNVYETKPMAQIQLMKEALKTLEIHPDIKTGSIYVSQKMLKDAEALPEHTEGLVDMIRAIKGIEVALIFQETSGGNYRISLRSKGKINVEKVAREFGGGGHVNAAACSFEGDIQSAKNKLVNAIKNCWV